MTSFKNFRNRGRDAHPPADGQPNSAHEPSGNGSADGDGRIGRSNATEMGPEHFEILRQIESEGEPLVAGRGSWPS